MIYHYVGDELNAFQHAKKWKRYWVKELFTVVPRNLPVLEIGSGIGGNAATLENYCADYTGFEPDENLVAFAEQKHPRSKFICGDIENIGISDQPRLLVYADVLEHIEDDKHQMQTASSALAPDSFIGILVPAHQDLYSKFDREIGHFRRYSIDSLSALVPPEFTIEFIRELDSIGYFLASLSKRFLNKGRISVLQIRIWDTLIPISKFLDSFGIFHGKSILMILKKH